MKIKLKKDVGKLKKGTVLKRHGWFAVHRETAFELDVVFADTKTFELIK